MEQSKISDAEIQAAQELQWRRTVNTDALVTYVAGDYVIHGEGYWVGESLRRRWTVWRGTERVSQAARLVEAKADAVIDLASRGNV